MDNLKHELVIDYYSYTIPSWSVCAIEYGEYDGLSDSEIAQVEAFLSDIDEKCGASLHSIGYGEEVSFRNFNDFNNLGDDCVECKVYFTTLEEV